MENFIDRHIGSNNADQNQMLQSIGLGTFKQLIDQTVPEQIKLKNNLSLPEAISEFQYIKELKLVAAQNKVFRSYIGLGYYNTITPPVIQRNILENPGWYTSYTPYQAEISQGRLEALLNFQTMVSDLTKLPIANASLLDEATAAAEAMIMFWNNRTKAQKEVGSNKFFVADTCFPQTIDVLKTRSKPLGIEIVISSDLHIAFSDHFFGILIQYPNVKGEILVYTDEIKKLKKRDIQICVATDLMALTLLKPPGEWGADCAVGNSQRFGVPMGYGGPHAAFFACTEEYKRLIPGRIIGVSKDINGDYALRMALQTREQHIKRDKATSNICTAQALLAIMASMYAVYHGPKRIKAIAQDIHDKTFFLFVRLKNAGYKIENQLFFDTIIVETTSASMIFTIASHKEINFRLIDNRHIAFSLDETCTHDDLVDILYCFSIAADRDLKNKTIGTSSLIKSSSINRTSDFLSHKIFNSFHTETEFTRYLKRLENKDLSLVHSMIALGSCTMKLNATSELLPISWPEFASIHPFVPIDQAKGYQYIIKKLESYLAEITGFSAISFQPNSGAQGEYAGLMVIREFHISNGENLRNVALIPASAHGTNPASAAMAGMKIIIVKCDDDGNVDVNDLTTKAYQNKNELSCLMITYPSTHGVYEEGIKEITQIIHQYGGLVYMDGANMNAQVGLTSPGKIGADVCHLNLHKTFAIPHGGGGPGVGAIGVKAHLKQFLPSHRMVKTGGLNPISAVSAAPFGSALILLISYGYIRMLGAEGLTMSTKMAILNANYMKERLAAHYRTLYVGKSGRCAHEFIIDCSEIKRTSGIEVGDIAKRLMDFGFHAPTVSFPVHDTLMIEPTESESKEEMDRFCDALITIHQEINEIINGEADKVNNVIKNAPHTMKMAVNDNWNFPYSRTKACFPIHWVQENKFWPSVGKIDNAFGDRNLICSCVSIEEYKAEEVTIS